ncbi:MAG: DUF294 nucleotidyltransferase-like domain-containing protein [Propionibacteriaceae bacterium]|nr:DUF294 nucleotidyltransferase-like domain-containing protein [Propionibacteriaceae bacterium]
MDIELSEIRQFLAQYPPFDELSAQALNELPRQLTARYYKRGSTLVTAGRSNQFMFVLRSGAVDILDPHGALVERSEPGTCFGMSSVIAGGPSTYTMIAREDSLTYLMPAEVFNGLIRAEPPFGHFFMTKQAGRIRSAVEAVHVAESGGAILKTRVRDILKRAPIWTAPTSSIRDAAVVMSEERVSALLVLKDEKLVGIVTDRDLRSKVIAVGRDISEPVSAVMTRNPHTIAAGAHAFEVLLDMTEKNVHHLPVLDDDKVIGLVTAGDLMRLDQANPIYLVGDIAKQTDLEGLQRCAQRLPSIVETYVARDASADDIGRVVTAVGDAFTRKLLNFAEAELGAPPVRYCWVALGSQARLEQGLQSDQDSAVILDDSVAPEQLPYFAQLTRHVVDGLEACGYQLCPGDMMATNPQWRQPLQTWSRYFSAWMNEPEPDALLNAQTFFDMRPIYGDNSLFTRLQNPVVSRAPQSTRFLTHLAKQCQAWQPPIGFFRDFVLETEGEHKNTLDLKAGGIIAIVQMARLFALSKGLTQVNTRARLESAATVDALSKENADNLADAFELINYVRLRHQVRQLKSGRKPDSHLAPADLTSFEKRHLRDAFGIVRKMQSAVAYLYQVQYL